MEKPIDANDVVKQIEINENLLHDIQCVIRLYEPETNVVYNDDCQWGYEKGKEFVSGTCYAKTEDGKVLPYKSIIAFDGKVVRSCSRMSHSKRSTGGIYGYDPFLFSVPIYPRTLLGHTFVQDGIYTLSELLSDKYVKNKEIKLEKLGDDECILLEANGFRAPDSYPIYDLRVWIDPKKNYRPLKIEQYESPDNENSAAGLKGEKWKYLERSIDKIELKQVDGIWFPVCGQSTIYTNQPDFILEGKITEEQIREQYPGMSDEEIIKNANFVTVPFHPAQRVEINEIKINKGIDPEKFTIVFPSGCMLWDDIAGIGYVVVGPEDPLNEGKNDKGSGSEQSQLQCNKIKSQKIIKKKKKHSDRSLSEKPIFSCVNESNFDWGVIDEGASIEHDFFIKNDGTKDLVIEDIKLGCGCTKAEISKNSLAPNETATLKVNYTGRKNPEKEVIVVWVKSNDQAAPVKEFSMTGFVKFAFRCRPQSLSFDLSTERDVACQMLHFSTNIGTFELVKCSAPDFMMIEWNKTEKEYLCNVKLKPEFSGSINQKITAEFNVDGEIKIMTVPVYILR